MRFRPATASAVGAALLAGLLQAAGAAQEPGTPGPPSFATAVDVILVDAVVTDRHGRPVEGLAAEDFLVREDGVPQALTSFEAVARPPLYGDEPSTPASAPRSSANDGSAASPGRVFVLVLDDAGLGLDGARAAREAAKRFLSEVARPGDVVSVVAPGAGLTWSSRLPEGRPRLASVVESVEGLKAVSAELAGEWEARQVAEALDPLTQERMRVRLDAAGQLPRATRLPGDSDEAYEDRNRILQAPFLRADSRRQLDRDRDRRRRLFGAVSAAVEAVAAVKGRKSILLLSEGFIQEPDDPPFRDLVAALRRANASIYYVDVRRPRSGAAADSRQAGDRSISTRQEDPMESGGAEGVADETGGFVVRAPAALDAGFDRIARESSTYYLLGYSSTNTKRDGKYRRLAVEVRRPDLEVRARRGYYGPGDDQAPRAGARVDSDPDLERALAGVFPERDISLRLGAFFLQPIDGRRVRVRLVGEVGLTLERFRKDADGSFVAALDVAMALNHVRAAGRQRTPWREWRVRVPSPAPGAILWVPLEGTFDVPGGACQARLAVRDRTSHALGTVVHELEVPDPGVWRVSTPVLSDVPGEELSRPPRVRFDRSFVAGARLYCYVEVYAGADAKGTPPPRASLAWTVVDAGGKSRKAGAPSPLTPGSEGRPARLETIPLNGLAPGEYELRLSVRDEASGTATELREPFVLRRPSRPDLAIYVGLLRTFLGGEVARASSGVMEWRPEDLARLAASLPADEPVLRRAALALHTALALRLWGNARALEAEAQVRIGRALLEEDAPAELHRDWLLGLGYSRLAVGSPLTALPFFEECARRFPAAAEAWLGAGICYELTAFPDGFAVIGVPSQGAAGRAERCYREAVRLDPHLAEARLRLGRVLGRAGAHDEADEELAAAEAASPDASLTALARLFRGALRDARGDLGGALRHYEAALAADPACQTAAFALGEALHRSGDRRRAAASLTSALATSRSDAVSPWHAYHVGSDRWKALLETPEEPPAVTAGPEPPSTP